MTCLPYYIIHIEKVNNSFAQHLLNYLQNPTILTLINSNLDQICNILLSPDFILVIDASFNKINIIESNCFKQAPFLKIIKLPMNR